VADLRLATEEEDKLKEDPASRKEKLCMQALEKLVRIYHLTMLKTQVKNRS